MEGQNNLVEPRMVRGELGPQLLDDAETSVVKVRKKAQARVDGGGGAARLGRRRVVVGWSGSAAVWAQGEGFFSWAARGLAQRRESGGRCRTLPSTPCC